MVYRKLQRVAFIWIILLYIYSPSYGASFIDNIVEICDNGLDDDNDGLIDSFDPDCSCSILQKKELVPNHDFESYIGCCNAIYPYEDCLQNWMQVAGTPDYYGINCVNQNQINSILEVYLDEFNESFVSIGGDYSYSESLANCLIEPLQIGKMYTIELEVAFPLELISILEGEVFFTVYGIPSCPSDLTAEIGQGVNNFCNSSFGSTAIPLIQISSEDIPYKSFQKFSQTFVATENTEAIVLSIDCNNSPALGSTFWQFNYVSIFKDTSIVNWDYNSSISHSDPCQSSVILSVLDADSLTYQWYKDSIIIDNENEATLTLDADEFTEYSVFHVFAFNENGCILQGPFSISSEQYISYDTLALCSGNLIQFGNQEISAQGDYQENFTTFYNCDSLVFLHVTALPSIPTELFQTICQGDSIIFNSQAVYNNGLYRDTLSAVDGCDSIVHLEIDVNLTLYSEESISICDGDQYPFGSVLLSQTGIYQDTLMSVSGCDSISILNLSFDPYTIFEETQFRCEDDVYLFGNQVITETGVYKDTLVNTVNCSVIQLDITFIEPQLESITRNICQGSYSIFGNDTLYIAGLYNDTLQNIWGCDSIRSLTLSVEPPKEEIQEMLICEGDTVTIQNVELYESGEYTFDLTTDLGCDSTLVVNVEVEDIVISDTLRVLLKEDETYEYNNQEYSEGIHVIFDAESSCNNYLILDVVVERNKDIYFPNIISPNSTSGNNRFQLFSNQDVFVLEYKIWDRWGNMVYKENNFTLSDETAFWDGRFQDKEVMQGVYVYWIVVRFEDGEIENYTGDVTVWK